jgi:hypothetical protein
MNTPPAPNVDKSIVGFYQTKYACREIGEYTKTYQYQPPSKSQFKYLFGYKKATIPITRTFSLLHGKRDSPRNTNIFTNLYFLAEKKPSDLTPVELSSLQPQSTRVECEFPQGSSFGQECTVQLVKSNPVYESNDGVNFTEEYKPLYTGYTMNLQTESKEFAMKLIGQLGFTPKTVGGERKRKRRSNRTLRRKTGRKSKTCRR